MNFPQSCFIPKVSVLCFISKALSLLCHSSLPSGEGVTSGDLPGTFWAVQPPRVSRWAIWAGIRVWVKAEFPVPLRVAVRALPCSVVQRDTAVPKPHSTSTHSPCQAASQREGLAGNPESASRPRPPQFYPSWTNGAPWHPQAFPHSLSWVSVSLPEPAQQRWQQAGAAGCCQTHTRRLNTHLGPRRWNPAHNAVILASFISDLAGVQCSVWVF